MNNSIYNCKFFITGGGTGGHIYPAVSIIKELLDCGVKNENIYYIGNKKNLEFQISKDNGFNFLSTSVFGMPRKVSLKFIKWIFLLILSILKSFYYVLRYKPNVVFGTGGYVSAPVLFAAKFLKIPYVLHDSDCYPGIVTRKFAKGAKAVNLAFEEANKLVNSDNIYNYKNPVRRIFFEKTKDSAREALNLKDEFVILIMGGSQGAKSINEAALEVIKEFENREDIKIILQTGKKNYDEIISNFSPTKNSTIKPYYDDMSTPVIASDLIVSRAGSISISEILSAKTPSILIPYPYAAADHQRVNARAISDKNAAIYLEDEDLKTGKLKEIILSLLSNKEKYGEIKKNAEALGEVYKNSNQKILELILNSVSGKN